MLWSLRRSNRRQIIGLMATQHHLYSVFQVSFTHWLAPLSFPEVSQDCAQADGADDPEDQFSLEFRQRRLQALVSDQAFLPSRLWNHFQRL